MLLSKEKAEGYNSNSSSSSSSSSSKRVLDKTTFSSIVSRAKYQLRVLGEGYSRGDSHRKHIKIRFEYLSSLEWQKKCIKCDRCFHDLGFNTEIFIHKRRSYNRFFHVGCARIMNLL